MQKNYLFFETELPRVLPGIFQKNSTNGKRFISKIVHQRFLVLFFLIATNLGYSQLATESFESGIPGTWAVTSNLTLTNNWTNTATGGYLSSGGAFVNPALNNTSGSTAEYYLISPQFVIPSSGEIRFWTKQGSFANKGTTYQVRISTANQPDISSFNVVLQSWTETQLNAAATTYEEKVVSLSSLPAVPVYIAFVAVTNSVGTSSTVGDSWFIDNARVISSCAPVTGITSTVTSNGATINWTHPTSNNFGIEVVANGAGHGATGTPVVGTTYTTPNNLTPNTTYDVYIITNCDATTSSSWAGPFQITTSMTGLTCANPIVVPTTVPTTPYVYSNNLSVFNDNTTYTEYSSIGNSCLPPGTTQNYLSGDHAFFSYTPTVDGLINITQAINVTGGSGNCYNSLTGVFIYDNCAGIGTSAACLGAATTDSDTPSTIFNVYVLAGHTYTIVVSSPFQHDTPGAGICFNLTISGSSCPAPSGITYQHLTQNGAEFSWNNIGNFVSNWEYVCIPSASGAPTGSETLLPTNTNLNNVVTGLLPNTSYNLYVRSVCSGTPGPWSQPAPFTTQCTVFALPYYTGFNSGGQCWTPLNLNNDSDAFNFGSDWNGEAVAKLRTSEAANFTNDMLVSPRFHFDGVTQKRLRFKYEVYGNWGLIIDNPTGGPGSFEIKLSTTGVGEQDFTTTLLPLASYTTGYNYIEQIVVLPSGLVGDVNIAWLLPNGATQTGVQFYIDDVYVEDLPACSEPSYPIITAGSITNTSAEVSWTNGYNNTQWQIVAQPLGTGTPTTTGILVNTNPYTLTGLVPSTQYELYIRAYCNATEQSTWAGPINFNTLCDPEPTPYYESLNDTDPTSKKFCWSKNNQNGDTTEWFINATDATISQAPSFFTPFGGFDDWLISGPVNAVGNKRLHFKYRVTTGIFAPGPRANYEVLMSTDPTFATYTILIPSHDFTNSAYQEDSVLFNGTGTIYIAFRVPPTMTDPANSGILFIDDVVIDDAPLCPDPSDLTATGLTSVTANLSWVPGNNETQWQVAIQNQGGGVPTSSGTIVNTTSAYNATGLTPDTAYEYYVKAVCNATDSSNWVGPFYFRTTCNPLPTPFTETFDTTSTTETCWTIINGNGNAYDWDMNETVNPIFGNQMAAIFSGTNGDNDDWLITPTLMAHAGQRLRFYYKVNDSSYTEDLKIKLSTNGTTVNQFTTTLYQNSLTTTTNTNGTVAGSNTITVTNTQDIRVGDVLYMPDWPFPYQTTVTNIAGSVITLSNAATATLTGIQSVELTHEIINNEVYKEMVIDLTGVTSATNINIGFYIPHFIPNPWNYRSQFLFIDNVIVEDIPACPSVINVTTQNIIDTTAQINWQTTGSATSWEISVQPFGTPAPVGATLPAYLHTATSHPYTVTGLTPATQYQYYIRAICSGSSQSQWIGPFEFTTRCDFANVCQYTITAISGNTGQVTDNVTVMQNGVVVQAIEFPGFGQPAALDYTVFMCSGVEFNLYWNGFGSGVQYSEAQIIVKDESNNVVWTSPLGLGAVNTNIYTGFASCGVITCPNPTNLAVSNQGVLSWTAGGSETQWEVFVQPVANGTLPQSGHIVSTPSYTPVAADFVNGAAATYEYFVRAVCSTSSSSYWSGPKVFVRNDEPSTSVHLQTNAGESCEVSGVDASFIGATASTVPTACPGINNGDIWYDFVATSKIHYIELSDFTPGSYYSSAFVGEWPKIVMSLYEVQANGSLVEKGCSENNSMTTMYSTELVVGTTYKIRLKLISATPNDKKFHICITTPNNICDVDAFNYGFEKLPMQTFSGVLTILDATVIPGWRVNTDWGTMFFLDSSNVIGSDPYSGGQFVQLTQDDASEWNPSDPNIKGLYKDFDTSEITKMDFSFASSARQSNGTTVQLFAGPPSGPFTVIAQDTGVVTVWHLVEGSYTVPTGQTNTRFIFRVMENGIGHLLDAANFKANVEININTANTTLDCTTTSMNFDANGVGQWVADSSNPATTIIANPNSGATNVSGFTAPGTYTFNWNTRYCVRSITITKQGTNDVATVTTPVNYCVGAAALTLTATAPSGDSLMWYSALVGGTGTTVAPTPQTTIAGTTSYYVSAVDTNGCEGPRTEIVVQVNALPTATISGTTTVCMNAPCTNITFTGANGIAPYTFTYTINSGSTQTITSIGNTATICVPTSTVGIFTYNLENVSSGSNCSQSQTGSAVVTVLALPTATISGTTTICAGQTATISFNGTPNATVTYTVNNGTNQTVVLDATGQTTITTATLTANTTYALVSVMSSGITACSQTIAGSAIVTVTPLVTPNVTFSYPQTCTSASINPLPVLTSGFATGGVFSSTDVTVDATTGAINLSTASVGTHQIIYTLVANSATCTSGATYTANISIVSSITPITGFSYVTTYCADSPNAIPTTVAGFTSGGVFSAGAGLIINSTTGEINIGLSTAGNYTITYTVAANVAACNPGGSSTFNSTIISDLSFTIEDFCQNGLTLQLTNPNFDTNTATYTWTQESTTIGTNATLNVGDYLTQNPSLNLPLVFTVSVGLNGCTTIQNYTVDNNPCLIIPKGISPNGDGLNDTLDLTGYGVKEISIFNRYGTKAYSFSGNYTNQWKGQSNEGHELPDGTYFYSIHTTDGATKTGWIYINRQY